MTAPTPPDDGDNGQGRPIIPPMDPALIARMEAAQDEHSVIHDPELANEYFEALQQQGDAVRRRNAWPEPIIEQGKVFPSAGDAPVLDAREDEPLLPTQPSTDEPPDDPQPVTVVIW